MKQYIVANWKSNKTELEATDWFQRFKIYDLGFKNKEVIICPSFTLLSSLKSYILNQKSPIKIGAQNISPFDDGAYTGEISSKQIKEFAEYVIIGHSERRKYFNETSEVISKKVELAINNQLIPIICVSDLKQIDNKWKMINGSFLIAYEPLFAIGSGNADTPEDAEIIANKIKELLGVETPVLYGGSVTSENIASFTKMPHINGLLVGKASLNPQEFISLISNA